LLHDAANNDYLPIDELFAENNADKSAYFLSNGVRSMTTVSDIICYQLFNKIH
jgi:hypothetical protein